MNTSPLYATLIVVHVLTAFLGFGALAATGYFASRAARLADPFSDPALSRFFRAGRNAAARALYLVPLFGAALLALGHGQWSKPFPWVGLFLWFVAMGVASALIWPKERVIQVAFATGDRSALREAGRTCERACAVATICFVLALVVMVIQPG